MKAAAGVGRFSETTQFGRFAPVCDSDTAWPESRQTLARQDASPGQQATGNHLARSMRRAV